MTESNLPLLIDTSRREWEAKLDAGGVDLHTPVTLRELLGKPIQLESGAVVMFQNPEVLSLEAGQTFSLANHQHGRYLLEYFDDYAAGKVKVLVTFLNILHDEEVDYQTLKQFLTRQRLLTYDPYRRESAPDTGAIGLFYRTAPLTDLHRVELYHEEMEFNPHRIDRLHSAFDFPPPSCNLGLWLKTAARWVPTLEFQSRLEYAQFPESKRNQIRLEHTGWGSDYEMRVPLHIAAQVREFDLPDGYRFLSSPEGTITATDIVSPHHWDEVLERVLIPQGITETRLDIPREGYYDTAAILPRTRAKGDPKEEAVDTADDRLVMWVNAIGWSMAKQKRENLDTKARFVALSILPMLSKEQFKNRCEHDTLGMASLTRGGTVAWVGWNDSARGPGSATVDVVVSSYGQHLRPAIDMALDVWTRYTGKLRLLLAQAGLTVATLSNSEALQVELAARIEQLATVASKLSELRDRVNGAKTHEGLLGIVGEAEAIVMAELVNDTFYNFDANAAAMNLAKMIAMYPEQNVASVSFAERLAEEPYDLYMSPRRRITYRFDGSWENDRIRSEKSVELPSEGASVWRMLWNALFGPRK